MESYVSELERKTRWYWRISSQLRERSLEQIPTFLAIEMCNDIVYGVNPARPLTHRMKKLRVECIMGELDPNPNIDVKVIPMGRTQ